MFAKKWHSVCLLFTLLFSTSIMATTTSIPLNNTQDPAKSSTPRLALPAAPDLSAKAYVLMDYNSGQIVAQKNADSHFPPASLTKLMTLYIVSSAIKSGQISLDAPVHVSEKAWKTGGSRMFINVNSKVTVKDLLQGVIVASGNDACVALAELVAGTESAFADMMNQTAQTLGMKNSHFTDSTGLPDANHYSSAEDFAILARALIRDFPDHYQWYKQKWFTYNNIKQPNRNQLLWRDESVDGLKTGHTDEAGFCLVASALRGDQRYIAVVMGCPKENARANDVEALLNYGYRFYESHKLFSANQAISTPRVWLGKTDKVPVGFTKDLFVLIPNGQYKNLKANIVYDKDLKAPLSKGKAYGNVTLTLDGKEILNQPIVALVDVPKGNIITTSKDHLMLLFKKWKG